MKNNGLIFLGFAIVCLVNLSAQTKKSQAPSRAVEPAGAQIKMDIPAQVSPAPAVGSDRSHIPTASNNAVASSTGRS